jgi:hypothetical protein
MVDRQYRDFAAGEELPVTPDFLEVDVSDKPRHLQIDLPPPNWLQSFQQEYVSRVRAVKSVDDLVGAVLKTLEDNFLLDNTYIFLTSDNGYQLGHHRLYAKLDGFHRTTNTPLFVMGPGIPQGAQVGHLLAHIDICPTILELAGASIPESVDGKSFRPLLLEPNSEDEELWQDAVMIENWNKKNVYGNIIVGAYTALRMHHEIFVSWATGDYEYYDLESDPFQLDNGWSSLSRERKQELKRSIRRFRHRPIDPIATLDQSYKDRFLSQRITLSGYAEDDKSVADAFVVLRSRATHRYWNGSSWQDEWHGNRVALENPDQPITIWNYQTEVTTETDSGLDELVFSYRAIDQAGNFTTDVAWHTNLIDGKAPEVDFDNDLNNQVFASTVPLQGTYFDGVSFDHVQLAIRDIDRNKYWNGNGFQSGWTFVVPQLATDTNWQYRVDLPPGHYAASVRGFDSVGNWQAEPSIIRFQVE